MLYAKVQTPWTFLRGCNPSTMKGKKLTAPHIDTYWLLSQFSLRLGTCPQCAEMLRERFLIGTRKKNFPRFARIDSRLAALRTPSAVRCVCANEPPFLNFYIRHWELAPPLPQGTPKALSPPPSCCPSSFSNVSSSKSVAHGLQLCGVFVDRQTYIYVSNSLSALRRRDNQSPRASVFSCIRSRRVSSSS